MFKPAAYPAAAMLLLSPFLGVGAGTFLPSFLFFVCMSQQFHAWSHMKKSELPGLVVAMQVRRFRISWWRCRSLLLPRICVDCGQKAMCPAAAAWCLCHFPQAAAAPGLHPVSVS